MALRIDASHQLRWFLLAALGAAACGGTTIDGGSGGAPEGGSGASATAGRGGTNPVGGSATGGGGSAGNPATVCDAPKVEAGFAICGNGLVHRVAQVACKNALPPMQTCTSPGVPAAGGEPSFTCDGSKLEYCPSPQFGQITPSSCAQGCTTDDQCGPGEICHCGSDVGHCEAATCVTDQDCQKGFFCREITLEHGIGCGAQSSFQCQLAADACQSAQDCPSDPNSFPQRCQPPMLGDPLQCVPADGPACGRPFLVDRAPRTAPLGEALDWALQLAVPASEIPASARAALAAGWAHLGLLEHASIAAFARFTLQLLALGAPHELVTESNAALVDETRHARMCFGLASAFAGRSVGPGPLDLQGALDRLELAEVALDTFLEGCIGETVAALEALEGSRRASAHFGAVRTALAEIAADEQRHAALAFRFVGWVLSRCPELADGLEQRLRLEADGARARVAAAAGDGDDAELEAGGLLGAEARAIVRQRAIEEVVRPCCDVLFSRAREALSFGSRAHA